MESKKEIKKENIDILHHVGLVNKNLDHLAAQYEKLGFTLTPLSLPKVSLSPGGESETPGVGNRRVIFESNYLELLGVPLARYEGLHVMHFGTDHIEQVKHRLNEQGTPGSPITAFQQEVQTEDGERTMKARTIHFPPETNPEGLLQVTQHDTSELIFEDRYMQHRNGALALTATVIVTEDPAALADKYARYTGHEGKQLAEGKYFLDLGRSKLNIVTPGGLETLIPGYVIPAFPFLAAFTVKTKSLEQVRKVLSGEDIPYVEKFGVVFVYPEYACGCAIIFTE